MPTSPIAALFGRSPIRPLQEHMKAVEACAAELVPLIEAWRNQDRTALEAVKVKIFTLENDADRIKNDIRSHLPKSLFMPVDRSDLLDLLNAQDSIADTVQDVAGLLVTRPMAIPDGMQDLVVAYAKSNHDATRQCRTAIHELDELVATSFRGRSVDRVHEMVDELNRLEGVTDDQGMELVRLLFEREDSMKPLDVVFWYELIRIIGDVADFAEDVGDRLRLLIAR